MLDTKLNPNQSSDRNRDQSSTVSADGKTPASVASQTLAFSSQKKCEATGSVESRSQSLPESTRQEFNVAFATQLQIRSCSESSLTVEPRNVDSLNRPNRNLLGGKGMFLTLMQNAGLAVPPFRCIETRTVEALESIPLDLKPMLATLHDADEFPLKTASLAAMKQFIIEMEAARDPSDKLSEKQQRWLNALAAFIAGPSCYQQIRTLSIADTIRTVHQDLCAHLPQPDSPIIVRSSGVAEDSFGNAQAGKYKSVVHGQADIVATCLEVLASTCRPAVFSQQSSQEGMSIILQQCIECQFGGVAMGYRALDDRTLVIEYGPGQPKTVVSGQYGIKPHCYEIKRNGEEWEATFIPGNPDCGFFLRPNEERGYTEQLIRFDSRAKASEAIGRAGLNTVVHGNRKLENALLVPVDIEFAIDPDGKVWFLQVRPITCLPGSSQFSMALPNHYLDRGTPVSDGCGSGLALAADSPISGNRLPESVVLFCDHGSDWLLAPEVLAKTKGVVLKKGARNDHISISLRQAGVPCILVDKPQWWPGVDSERHVTLICGQFQKRPGGFLLSGDREQELLRFRDDSASPDYQTALAIQQAWQPVLPEQEPSVAVSFSWLCEQNSRLLNFLGSERLINLCLSKSGVVQLSMHPERAKILQGCAREISNFLQETEAFLSGYEQFLMLGAAADHQLEQPYREEITRLRQQLALVQAKVEQTLANVTRPFFSGGELSGKELPISGSDFQQWQADCQLLKIHLQRLEPIGHVHRIESVHELILWLHKCFLGRLWPVATASGQGKVSRVFALRFLEFECDNFDIVDLSTSQEQPLFNSAYRETLRRLVARRVTVLTMPDYARLTTQLQQHACTIELLEQADGGKQRTLRLCYAEGLAGVNKRSRRGKFLRLWFLTQTLSRNQENSGFNTPNIHFNEQTGQVLLEFTHLPSQKDMQQLFEDIVSFLPKLLNIDFLLSSLNLDEHQTQWNMAALRERLTNPAFAASNQFAMEHMYWCFAYKEEESLITRFTHDKTLRHLVEAARIFSDVSNIEIEALLNGQTETHRQTLLWHFLLADPGRAVPLVGKHFNWLNDETTAMRLVSQNGHILEHLAPKIRHQRAIVFAAIKSHPEAIVGAPESFRNDFEIMNSVLANTTKIVKMIPLIGAELSSNHELYHQLLATAVENKSSALACDDVIAYRKKYPEYHNELLRLALERNKGDSYKLYSIVSKKNRHVDPLLYRQLVLSMLTKTGAGDLLEHCPDLNDDREIIYTAVGSEPSALEFAGREFQADKVLVKEAVENKGSALAYASDELKDDREIVLAAVKNYGTALTYASGRLKADPIIVAAALDNDGSALKYASEHFKHDSYYLKLALGHQALSISWDAVAQVHRGNKELLTVAVSRDPANLKYADRKLKDDEELAQLAVQGHGQALRYASFRLRDHEGIVRLAVQNDGTALEYANRRLRADKELVKLAVQNSGLALAYASEWLQDCPEVVKLALQQDPLALKYASSRCRNNPDLMITAVQKNGMALRYVGRSLQSDPQIIAAAINSVGAVVVKHIQQQVAR